MICQAHSSVILASSDSLHPNWKNATASTTTRSAVQSNNNEDRLEFRPLPRETAWLVARNDGSGGREIVTVSISTLCSQPAASRRRERGTEPDGAGASWHTCVQSVITICAGAGRSVRRTPSLPLPKNRRDGQRAPGQVLRSGPSRYELEHAWMAGEGETDSDDTADDSDHDGTAQCLPAEPRMHPTCPAFPILELSCNLLRMGPMYVIYVTHIWTMREPKKPMVVRDCKKQATKSYISGPCLPPPATPHGQATCTSHVRTRNERYILLGWS